jgi:hypothetical protein
LGGLPLHLTFSFTRLPTRTPFARDNLNGTSSHTCQLYFPAPAVRNFFTLQPQTTLDSAADQLTDSMDAPPRIEQFPFLRLPPELRNRVYDFALTSDTPLHYEAPLPTTSKPFLRTDDNLEFNQLKYVSKQLFKETKRLEWSQNTILFARTHEQDDMPGKMFLDFWTSTEAERKKVVKWVRLENEYERIFPLHGPGIPGLFSEAIVPDTLATLRELSMACRTFASEDGTVGPRIDYVIPGFNLHNHGSKLSHVVYGTALELYLRNNRVHDCLWPRITKTIEDRIRNEPVPYADGLRFWPTPIEEWTVLTPEDIEAEVPGISEEKTKQIIDLYQRWHDEGI